jgi:phage terminase large subunit-like protein
MTNNHRPVWSTSCTDWADRIRRGDSIIPPPIFPDQAEEALAIFKSLRIVDAPGSPTMGEACAEWVFDIVRSIFGSYDAKSGRRLIREWFICIPKKSSKSTLAAGVMMTALVQNWRESAEFAVLAPTVEVANNAYSPARDMVRKDEELGVMMLVQAHEKKITHREKNATLKVLAADSNTVGGKKSVGTLIDELHLFGKVPSAENMFREALGGLASRPEGFVIYLTTQSDEPPAGVFKQKLQYARDVRDGVVIDNGFQPIIYEHPPEMVKSGEHLLLENMWMVNPNLGYSVDKEFLEREYRKAENAGPESLRGFLAKHANCELGLNLRSDRWAGADYWEQAALPGLTLNTLLERCEVVDVGIDGGGLDDLLGLALIGRDRVSGRKLHWGHAWAHPSVLERRKQEAARFKDFSAAGDLTLVQQIGDDVTEVVEIIRRVHDANVLDKIGVDPYGIGTILEALVAAGIPEDKIVGINQGWKMAGAIKTTERWLAEGQMGHCGSDMMAWCVGNAKIVPVGNAVSITKQASGNAKIDPLMALLNAASLMALNPESTSSVYNERGFVSV